MDNTLRIKISIADRVYPLTISYEQEEGLRKAAKRIDAMLKQYEENYAVRDRQDLLAMCALELASFDEQKVINQENDQTNLLNLLKQIDSNLDNVL
nr:cell division protein ZapA [uncultured Flavobacterium sp.]